MSRSRQHLALVIALGAVGLLIWLGRDPLFVRTHEPAPPGAPPLADASASPAPTDASGAAASVQVPIVFLPNAGQADPSARFLAPGGRGTLWFTDEGVVLGLRGDLPGPRENVPTGARALAAEERIAATVGEPAGGAVIRLQFEGARATTPRAEAPGGGRVSYFLGSDPSRWQTDLPIYGALVYEGLYPGIDLRYEGLVGALKGTYTLAPGADPMQIGWRYEGAGAVSVDPLSGDLLIAVGVSGEDEALTAVRLRDQAPVAWQEVGGTRASVPAAYAVAADGRVSLALGDYRPDLPLVIDPQLAFSSYLGGTISDYGYGIAVDGAGNAYVTGYTDSADFPTRTGAFQPGKRGGGGGSYDAFVAKLNPALSGAAALVYASYLGGTFSDYGYGIAVDGTGNAYVTGKTNSVNFPTTTGAFRPACGGCPTYADAFVAKVNPAASGAASLVYASYLGGGSSDSGNGIAVDGAGNAYVTGQTNSANFPATTGAFGPACGGCPTYGDAFVAKVNPAASGAAALVYASFLGGTDSDTGYGIAVDGAGNAYLTGGTYSMNFPTTTGAFQPALRDTFNAFVAKLNPAASGAASLVYASYLGGGSDSGNGIAVDGAGNAYVTGYTQSANFPTTTGAFRPACGGCPLNGDAFLAKVSTPPTGTGALLYASYLGGSGSDGGGGVAVDGAGNAYLIGGTDSTDFPATPDAFQPGSGGGGNAFVVKMNPAASGAASLVYASYLGGGSIYGIAVDGAGNAYLTGETSSTNFPTTTGAFQPGNRGGGDAFVVKANLFATAGLAVSSGPNPSVYGQLITLTATLSPPSAALPPPTGLVTFTAGALVFGPAAVSGGKASFATSALPSGNYPIGATYGGDAKYQPTAANGAVQVVQPASTTVGLAGAPNSAPLGQTVTFTATVGVVAPGAGVPDGTVSFYDGASHLGDGTLSGGVATYSASGLSVGGHSITAVYNGAANFLASSSAPLSLEVQAATPTPTSTSTTLATPTATATPTGGGQRVFLPAVLRR